VKSQSDLSADQDSQPEVTPEDDQARYSPADENSRYSAPESDMSDDVIIVDREDDDIDDDDDDDVGEIVDAELAEPTGDLAEPAGDLGEPAGVGAAGSLAEAQNASGKHADLASRPDQMGTTQQWLDIQATFVDDPSGSVQLALQAVDGALTTFVDGLRQRQAALTPDADPGDTERLRATLRSCRAFWENLASLGDQLGAAELTPVRSPN
jgi:hypothetical protein